MYSNVDKPLRVVVYSLDPPATACPQVRFFLPLKASATPYTIVWGTCWRPETGSFDVDLPAAQDADVIVITRLFPSDETAAFIKQILASGKPVIYETDDLLTDIPQGNPFKPAGDACAPYINDLMGKAALVTVSTDELKQHYTGFTRRIAVLPNRLDLALWAVPRRVPQAQDSITIGFAGGIPHAPDLEMLDGVLERIAANYGDRVAFRFLGFATERQKRLPGFRQLEGSLDYSAYPKLLHDAAFDIALAPLLDNPFNCCKSNIKWLEYSACGFAGIYADLPSYNTIVEHGRTGLLVGPEPDQWFRAIQLLIEHPELREQLGCTARQEVLDHYALATGTSGQLNLYRQLLTGTPADGTVQKDVGTRKKYSIIILTWNRAEMLDRCLASLFAMMASPDECEIIVGNNGSNDHTESVLQRYRIDRCITKQTNIGLELYCELFSVAEGEFIIVIDDDVLELPRHFEREFERYFEWFPDYGLLGLDVVQDEFTNGAKPPPANYHDDTRHGRTIQEGPVVGCCLCIRSELFTRIGCFDGAELSMGQGEDSILYQRVRQAGLRAGIMLGVRCFHACGPHYSRSFGYVERDRQKYLSAHLNHLAANYGELAPAVIVSIIIPVFNKAEYTRRCLDSLGAVTGLDIPYEVIVVDNASTDGTAAFLAIQRNLAHIITNDNNLGFAKACNQGAAQARGEFLLFLNNDTELLPGWLEPLVRVVADDPAVAAVGPKLLFPDGTIQHAGVVIVDDRYSPDPLAAKHIWHGKPADTSEANLPRYFQALTAACLLVRKDVFKAVGGFDEGYWNGYEDVDLCFKVGQAGWRLVYQPASVVIHFESKSGAERFARTDANVRRLHDKWLGVIRSDIIIDEQQMLHDSFGIDSGLLAPYTGPAPPVGNPSPVPLVSIVIPVFNKMEYTRQCLAAIKDTAGTALIYEIIVVDNASTDGTAELLAGLGSELHVVTNAVNRGFAVACNQGAAASRGRYLLFLNNDTQPLAGWLEPLVRMLDDDPRVGAAGSKLLFPDGTLQHAGVMIFDDRQTGDPLVAMHVHYQKPGDFPLAATPQTYQALTAACLMIRKGAFDGVGGFDEDYWNGYEDVDLCFKLGQAGWKLVYQPASVVIHFESKSGPERFRRSHDNIRRLHEKWLGTIKPDIIFDAQGEFSKGPGIASGMVGAYTGPSPQTIPQVSIIIPVFNKIEYTRQCLENLWRNTGQSVPYEVIVVDNASTDGTYDYLISLGTTVRHLANSVNLGFARACNQGGEAAHGEYLVFLNNDTVPQPGWLEALLAGATADGADIVGAKLIYPDGTIQHAGVTFIEPGDGVHVFKGIAGSHPAVNRKRFMQCVTGACLLVGRELFRHLGGFDESFLNGFEDVDFCLRAREQGKRVLYNPESVIIHFEETTEGRKAHDNANRALFLRRWQNRMEYDTHTLYETEGFFQPIGDSRADALFDDLGSNDNAVFIYCQVLKRYPGDSGALLNLARACLDQKKPQDAVEFLRELLAHCPGHQKAQALLSRCLSQG